MPAPAFAQATTGPEESDFDPAHEWELQTWGPELKIGPIDMSINKAVAYLLLGTIVSIAIGIVFMRVKVGRDPTGGRRSARRSTRSRRSRSRSRASRRRRSGAGSRTSRR